MGSRIRIPTEDTLQTLQKVLKKRIDADRIIKDREKNRLSRDDYQLLRADLNNTRFLQPMDADNTKASIYYIRQKFSRYCDHIHAGQWDIAILEQNCDKGMMMSFLYWICETYLAKKRKKGKRKSVNQYWRDFKMLYRRVNGRYVDANDSGEVIKYINGELKSRFGLDNTCKPKPVAGPDDLLLLLVQHWARDDSVFPTEDDRLVVATVMLFQAYTGGRPAEFVHSSKGKASRDPLGDANANKYEAPRKASVKYHDDESDAGDDLGYDSVDLADSDDDVLHNVGDDKHAVNKQTDKNAGHKSGYGSDWTDNSNTDDTEYRCTVEVTLAYLI